MILVVFIQTEFTRIDFLRQLSFLYGTGTSATDTRATDTRASANGRINRPRRLAMHELLLNVRVPTDMSVCSLWGCGV